MIIFGDYSTYHRIYNYSYDNPDNQFESVESQNTTLIDENVLLEVTSNKQPTIHLGSSFDYQFNPEVLNVAPIETSETQNSVVKELAEEAVKEVAKDVIAGGLIALGTWLAKPDPVAGPIDEIVGILLIWTGRIIRVI
jgi:hypothetical protein